MKVLNWLLNFFRPLAKVLAIVFVAVILSFSLEKCDNDVVVTKPTIDKVQKHPIVPNDNVLIVKPDGTEVKKKIETPKPDVVISVPTSDSTDVSIGVKKTNPFFPDFKKRKYDIVLIDGDSTRVAVAHQSDPVLDFELDLQVGVSRSLDKTYLSLGTTPLKVGPVYLGPSINTDFHTVNFGADGVIKLKENIVIGVSVDPLDLDNSRAVLRVRF